MQPLFEQLYKDEERFIALRRHLHQNPELAFEEHETSALVATLLEEWGYAVERGIGTTGVVGRLRLGDGARSVGLRADMDALPITEATNLPYASRKPGIMHACGHDGHTVMLLAAAKTIAERKRLDGTLTLIFQPAEEIGVADCGAARMIRDGLFERFPVDAVFGMHNMPGYPQGRLAFADGPMAASSDQVRIVLHGRGGHGAMPQKAADPVVAGASIVIALQTIVSRNVAPLEVAVVTVGVFRAGTVPNIIPQTAELELTVRALNPHIRDLLQQRITDLVQAQAASFNVEAQIEYMRGYPALVNSVPETEIARQTGLDLLGEASVIRQVPPMTGSEDFAFMLEQCPGSYMLIGNGHDGAVGSCAVHNPAYDFNDANIVPGAAYWTLLAERFLSPAKESNNDKGGAD